MEYIVNIMPPSLNFKYQKFIESLQVLKKKIFHMGIWTYLIMGDGVTDV